MRPVIVFATLLSTTLLVRIATAHEHMYIGSDRPRGGTLVLRYDFARPFPLAPIVNGTGYLGTDPAFNAQVTDDPTDGIYRLKNRTRVKMELTAIDPEVSINFNGTEMKAAGDKAKIGKMPYLHQHPQWMLNVPAGVYGEYHLAFRVTATGYKPSQSYVATVSNVIASTTTTTTLPGTACTPGECDDHDACTVDTCDAGGCHHADAVDVDAVRCRLAGLSAELDDVRPTTAKGRRIVGRLFKIVNTVEPALEAIAAGGTDAPRRLKRAVRSLNRFSTVVDQGVHLSVIPTGDGDTLRTLAGDAYDHLVVLAP